MPSLAVFNNWCGALQVSKAYATKQLIFIYFIIYFPLIQEIPTEITILICGESCWQKNQTISNPLSKQRSGEGWAQKQLGGGDAHDLSFFFHVWAGREQVQEAALDS